jgi:hypothetical protein
MFENPLFVPTTVAVLAALNLLTLVLLLRLSGKVARLSRPSAAPAPAPAPAEAVPERGERTESAAEQTKWFDAFLAEDPARRELPKKEQFAAFRRWRAEKGMNWRAPAQPS